MNIWYLRLLSCLVKGYELDCALFVGKGGGASPSESEVESESAGSTESHLLIAAAPLTRAYSNFSSGTSCASTRSMCQFALPGCRVEDGGFRVEYRV